MRLLIHSEEEYKKMMETLYEGANLSRETGAFRSVFLFGKVDGSVSKVEVEFHLPATGKKHRRKHNA